MSGWKCILPLGFVAALTVACGDRALAPQAPLRLLAGDATITVDWPDAERKIPESMLEVFVGEIPTPGRLARPILHRGEDERDGRIALLAPTGSRYRFALRLPEGLPTLEVALGYNLEGLTPGVTLRYLVELTDSRGRLHEILDRTVVTEVGGRWIDQRIPLTEWAGDEVAIDLRVEGPEGSSLWPAWATPEIVDDRSKAAPSDAAATIGPKAGLAPAYDLILVVLDTLRADRLGSYGYEQPTSPFLDNWVSEGTRFETAISQSSWTRPSHRSLFSGLYPTSRRGLTSPPLAEVLWRAGYRTSALTGGAQLAYRFGFSRGFETHRIERWVRDVERVVDELERNRGRKSFLFLHTYEIHDPYRHGGLAAGLDPGRVGEVFERATLEQHGQDLTSSERDYVNALYDSGIRYVDDQLAKLFARLEETDRLDQTLVVITSDHGEELWDHGHWGHGHAMFDHQTRVPLLVHLPEPLRRERGLEAAQGLVVEQPVRLLDLYPTLLDLLQVPLDHSVQGRSIVPLFDNRQLPPADALSESIYWGPLEVKSLRDERYKYLRGTPKKAKDGRKGWQSLFDLVSDPSELNDISHDDPERTERMRTLLDILTSDAEMAEETIPKDLDPELAEQLKALGYL